MQAKERKTTIALYPSDPRVGFTTPNPILTLNTNSRDTVRLKVSMSMPRTVGMRRYRPVWFSLQ